MLLANHQSNCATGAVAFRPKKSASRVLWPRLARVVLRGLLCGSGIDFGTSGADDLIGGAEDFLGALFGDRFRVKTVPSAHPILNIPSAKLCPLKPQRFTTKKRHGFRFDLAQTARRGISVGEFCLGCVA